MTGKQPLWNVTLPGPVKGTVALSPDGKTLFALADESRGANASLHSIRASDGHAQWSVVLPCTKQYCNSAGWGPVAAGAAVYVATQGGIFRVSASTGQPQWNYPMTGDSEASGQPLLAPVNG